MHLPLEHPIIAVFEKMEFKVATELAKGLILFLPLIPLYELRAYYVCC